jgi:hypothetical protein
MTTSTCDRCSGAGQAAGAGAHDRVLPEPK